MESGNNNISLSAKHADALARFDLLVFNITELENEKADLILHAAPNIEARYLSCVGKLKLEMLGVQSEIFRLRRTLEHIQACINHKREILPEVIRTLVENEVADLMKKIGEEALKLELATIYNSFESIDPDTAIELKKVYRKLVKRLHPDLNPSLDAEHAHLWPAVYEAYKNSDLDRLKMLEIISENVSPVDDSGTTLLDVLLAKTEQLSAYSSRLLKEISTILNSFPFTVMQDIEDPDWVISENNKTLNEISILQDEKRALMNEIAKLTTND